MSLRVTSKENFADGTGISGARIDKAMGDLLARFNSLPKRDIARRFTQQQLILGWVPETIAVATRLPYMTRNNANAEVTGATPDAFENALRTKSIFHDADIDQQYVWTTAIYFKRPVILTALDFVLVTDTVFAHTFQYDGAPPAGKTANDWVDDFHVLLTVDSPHNTDDMRDNALVLRRGDYRAEVDRISVATPTGASSFRPNHPNTELLQGVWVQLKDLYVPLPKDSRVRFSLVLPHWSGNQTPWGPAPWSAGTGFGFVTSGTLTWYEEIE